jgi:integrase
MSMAAQRVRDYLVPSLGTIELSCLCPDDLRAYRLSLEARELAPRTVRHLLADARSLVNWAVEGGMICRSPFPRRVMPRIQESPPDRLNDRELEAVLSIGEPHAFIVRLALATGLRWGELVRARSADVSHGMIVVHRTKSTRVRRVPLNPSIEAEIALRGDRPLVPYVECANGSFNKLVRRRSGVGRFHVHQLRHTFACRWIESGGSLPALQQVLGHQSVTTTQQYARLSDEMVRREAERIHETTTRWRPLARTSSD